MKIFYLTKLLKIIIFVCTSGKNNAEPRRIPWKDYKLGQWALMAPFGMSVGMYLQLVWKLSKGRSQIIELERLPDNAILYDFHVDVATNFITMHLLREAGKKVIFPVTTAFFHTVHSAPAPWVLMMFGDTIGSWRKSHSIKS